MVCERPPRTICRPIAAGSEASFARQNASLTMASGWPTSLTSNVRPRAGATPSSVSNPGVTSVALTPSAAPSPVSVMFVGSYPSIAARDPARSRQPSNVSYLTERGAAPRSSGRTSPSVTSDLGSANGGGVSSTASTTAKIDAPAPSVSDSDRTAATALTGERRRFRNRWRTSVNIEQLLRVSRGPTAGKRDRGRSAHIACRGQARQDNQLQAGG